MKFKYQGAPHSSGIESSWSGLKDTKLEHIDLGEFSTCLQQDDKSPIAEKILQSGLAHARGFLTSV